MKKKGFTLIELIMVIVILGILAAVAIPRYIGLADEARIAAAQGAIGAIRAAVAMEYARSAVTDTAAYPDAGDIAALFTDNQVPENPLPPASRVINGESGSGGWTYVQGTGVVTSNDTATTDL